MESFELKYSELIDECAAKDPEGNNKMISVEDNQVEIKDPEKFKKELKELDDKLVPVVIEKIEQKEFEGVKMEGSDNMFALFDHVIK